MCGCLSPLRNMSSWSTGAALVRCKYFLWRWHWLRSATANHSTSSDVRIFNIPIMTLQCYHALWPFRVIAVLVAQFLSVTLADIFSQISDSNGHLGLTRFSEYLQEVLTLPAAVYESPSFPYSEDLAASIFDGVGKDTLRARHHTSEHRGPLM